MIQRAKLDLRKLAEESAWNEFGKQFELTEQQVRLENWVLFACVYVCLFATIQQFELNIHIFFNSINRCHNCLKMICWLWF